MQSGVYTIRNRVNGLLYVGSSVQISRRWNAHRCDLRRRVHNNQHLQRSWTLYGEDTFEFGILELCPIENLIEREQFWIDHFDASNPRCGYNIGTVAGSAMLGRKHKPESIAKMAASLRGQKRSPEFREKMALIARQRYENPEERIKSAVRASAASPETKAKISKSLLGRPRSETTKARLRETWKRKVAEGWTMPTETRLKIGEASRSCAARKRLEQLDPTKELAN